MDHKLIAEIKRRGIPPIDAQENKEDPTMFLELTLFPFPWRWYVSEAEIEDGDVMFYGFVNGDFNEWGYFWLSEMENSLCPLLVNYDFQPMPFSDLKKEYQL